ncbi:MAG: hypothetical protein ACK4UL_04535 [Novosphingobium meiothermophilum]
MDERRNRHGKRPARNLPWQIMLPFALPFMLTLALIVTIGEAWPRQIAPGSGLKFEGLIASTLTAALVWHRTARQHDQRHFRILVGCLCAVTGMMGWPVWTLGILPSINGSILHDERESTMRLAGLETSQKTRQRGLYHWARVEPLIQAPPIAAGRLFIAEDMWQRLARSRPDTVRVRYADGLLGERVILGLR